jgi:hypothetical protein
MRRSRACPRSKSRSADLEAEADLLQGRELVEQPAVVRAEAHLRGDRRVAPGTLSDDEDPPEARCELARDAPEERRLARAVRAEEAGHARLDRDRDVVDRDDAAVPLGELLHLDARALAHPTTSGRDSL